MYKKLFEFIFFVVLITIMVMSLNLAILDSTGMTIEPINILKYTFVIVLTAAILLKYPITLLGAAVIGISAGVYVYVKQIVIPSEAVAYFGDFFAWLPNYIVGYESFDLRYSLLFAVLYILLTTAIITLIVFSKKFYGLLLVLGTSAFAFFWFIYVEKARAYMFYYLFAALILYSYNVYDRKKLEWLSSETHIDKNIEIKWVFNSLLIVLVSLAISQFAILDIKPVKWNWLSEKAIQVFPFIADWRNDNLDGYSFGFGSKYGIEAAGYKTSKLGGPVKLSDKIMLLVETDSTDDIYMRGVVKDLYTGNSWRKSKKTNVEYSTESKVPLPYQGSAAFYIKELKVNHPGMITSTVFAPNALESIKYRFDKFYIDQDNEVYFPKSVLKKDSYIIKAAMPYINYNELKKVDTASLASELYKQLPDNITPRVKKLALDITSKYNNDFDKAAAIESYLRKNYKYTLTPSEIPEGAEFVDYFLFEGKEGYCTYFASSMAVLLRASGIPCRYVEGFLAKYNKSFVRNVPGTDAHAWVEVNFGAYGWINFEATPAYPLAGYRTQRDVSTAPIVNQNPDPSAVPVAPVETTTRDRNLEIDEEEGVGINDQVKREIPMQVRIILVFAGIIILRVLYLLLKQFVLELKLKKSIGKHYAALYFNTILKYLKKADVKMNKDETMREFWFKVKHLLGDSYGDGDEIIKLLEQARYSSEPAHEEERMILEEYRKMMKKYVTTRLGTIKAFLSFYLVGV